MWLLCLAWLCQAGATALKCSGSGYCSVGLLSGKPFVGDIAPSGRSSGTLGHSLNVKPIRCLDWTHVACLMPPADGLRAALASCSFKNETILLTTTLSVLDNALQLYDSITNLGLAHQIVLTPDEQVRHSVPQCSLSVPQVQLICHSSAHNTASNLVSCSDLVSFSPLRRAARLCPSGPRCVAYGHPCSCPKPTSNISCWCVKHC